jgi:hypothetical protein
MKAPVSGEFADKLEEIRTGKSPGATFDAQGSVWKPKDEQVLLVALVSKNVRQEDLTPTLFYDTLDKYTSLLDNPDVVAGVFAYEKDGKKQVSIDVNAVVPAKHKKMVLKFATDNNQIAVWDQAKGDEIKTGGTGETKLKGVAQAQTALELLRKAKPFTAADVIRQVPGPWELGLDIPENEPAVKYRRKEIADLTMEQFAEKFPETVIPKSKKETIPSDTLNAPLVKGLKNEAAKVRVYADKMVEEARKWLDHPLAKLGAEWYNEIQPAIKKAFGKDAQIFTELLAATSPKTAVPENFRYAVAGFEAFKRGDYNAQIVKYLEGIAGLETGKTQALYEADLAAGQVPKPPRNPSDATYMANWIRHYDLRPVQSNGSLYGTHSIPVLQVFARTWLNETRGLKVNQFVRNLLGLDDGATIDLWADRTMRRLGYSGLVERWRIPPKNGSAVSNADFRFSQKVFADAAKQLNMKPSALQGLLWFGEKQHWADKGWATLELDSYLAEMPKLAEIKADEAHAKAQQKLAIEPRKK